MIKILLFLIFPAFCFAQSTDSIPSGWAENETAPEDYSWFNESYNEYSPVAFNADSLITGYEVLIFAGTWCKDTRHLLPRFYKITDEEGINRDRIKLYWLDRNKESPDKLEAGYQIERIPTFIFYNEDEEIGRIIESVDSTLEDAIIEILIIN